jgi:hypothetical protein
LPAVETPETLMYFYNSNNNNVFKVIIHWSKTYQFLNHQILLLV